MKISMTSHHLKNRVSVPLILAFNFLYIFVISYISYAFLQIECSNYIDKSLDLLSPTHTITWVFAASLCSFCYTLECFSHLSTSHPTIYTVRISSWTNFFRKAILVLPFYTDYAVSLYLFPSQDYVASGNWSHFSYLQVYLGAIVSLIPKNYNEAITIIGFPMHLQALFILYCSQLNAKHWIMSKNVNI